MIKSPCTGICTLINNNKLCVGCGRSIDEIVNWVYLSNDKKEKIIQKINDKSILEKNPKD
tara:strand:+ start:411 stop:590 length:180 start_codon:yes stop_codon:yes gene_type:complete